MIATGVRVNQVDWYEPSAVALRAAMDTEFPRGSSRPAGGRVAYAGVAVNRLDLPVGHVALRWRGSDVELDPVYVMPAYRGRGVVLPLIAAAERAAAQLGARRIVVPAQVRRVAEARLDARRGYTAVPDLPGEGILEKRLAAHAA